MEAYEFDNLSDLALDGAVDLPRVLGRCTHESKTRMIHALNRRNRVVVMTGDGNLLFVNFILFILTIQGVNDAPALTQANVGVAMGISGMHERDD